MEKAIEMKLIGTMLLACGFLTAQEAQNRDENAARMAAG